MVYGPLPQDVRGAGAVSPAPSAAAAHGAALRPQHAAGGISPGSGDRSVRRRKERKGAAAGRVGERRREEAAERRRDGKTERMPQRNAMGGGGETMRSGVGTERNRPTGQRHANGAHFGRLQERRVGAAEPSGRRRPRTFRKNAIE